MAKNSGLTRQEIRVLALIAEGKSSKEVAGAMFISKRTVDFHLANAYKKLKASNRVQAIKTVGYDNLMAKAAAFAPLEVPSAKA